MNDAAVRHHAAHALMYLQAALEHLRLAFEALEEEPVDVLAHGNNGADGELRRAQRRR